MGLSSSNWGYKLRTSRRSLGLRHKVVSQQHTDNKITLKNQYRQYTVQRENESNPRINPGEVHYECLGGRKIERD